MLRSSVSGSETGTITVMRSLFLLVTSGKNHLGVEHASLPFNCLGLETGNESEEEGEHHRSNERKRRKKSRHLTGPLVAPAACEAVPGSSSELGGKFEKLRGDPWRPQRYLEARRRQQAAALNPRLPHLVKAVQIGESLPLHPAAAALRRRSPLSALLSSS